MSLADKLSAMRAASAGRIPAEKQAIMHRATEDLRRSGILDRIAPVGSRMPPFDVANNDGRSIVSNDLLASGPLVLSFFRGSW